VRDDLKQEMQRQTKGLNPETAPARPMAAADLKGVPEKADPQAVPLTAGKDKRGKSGRSDAPTAVVVQPPIIPGTSPVQPGATDPATAEKIAREKGRSKTPPESVIAAPGAKLKPFNPVAETDQNAKPQTAPTAQTIPIPNNNPPAEAAREKGRKPSVDPRQSKVADPVATTPDKSRGDAERAAAQAEQDRLAKQRAAAAQQQQQMESQRNAQLQSQQEQAAGAARQKAQADQDRAARKQAEAAAFNQQKQLEAQQQQRAAQEASRQLAEQQRRAQDAQRERTRPQPAAQPPQPTAPAHGATPTPADGKHRKDKDKDKDGGN
jgi:hypothetical protein